ncbi:MAG: peptidoglycan DD-metalloendopeptidase family protein [Thiohalospira sp.]
MRRRALPFWLPLIPALLGLLAGCAPVFTGDRTQQLYWHPRYHTVSEGDTLYSIAWRYGYEPQTVAEWNDIDPPYTIEAGERIRVAPPAEFGAREARAGSRGESGESGGDAGSSDADGGDAAAASPEASGASKPRKPAGPPPEWAWPVEGEVVREFRGDGNGKKGIGIAGEEGDPVRASAGGRVVYAGSGLIGYGRLIIIKHGQDYLSAYAHNRRLLADEGDRVEKGDEIAEMGDTGADRVMLHFEIREGGKPVDPGDHLPAQ